MSTTIRITACDNEFTLKATQPTGSYDIADIKSGNNNPVDVTITIDAGTYSNGVTANGVNGPLNVNETVNLPAGTYSLVAVGYNWGGPSDIKYSIDGIPNGTEQNNTQVGVIFTSLPFQITV